MAKTTTLKKMRRPPASTPDLGAWIKTGETEAQTSQVASNPASQSTSAPAPRPKGKGIVQRADGSYKRRLVVYVDPERALLLKANAALQGADMSDIIDELLEGWLETQA